MSESIGDLPSTGGPLTTSRALELLRSARELNPIGRIVDASNVTLLCALDDTPYRVIYKPIRGEEPLWDFPDGSLAAREVAAFEVSEALGLHVVPPTLLRDGALGEGAVQLWIEHDGVDEAIRLVNAADESLRPITLFDAIINNGDRKAGHLLPITDKQSSSDASGSENIRRRVLGVDHGVTFAADPKLRTVLWHWRSTKLSDTERRTLERASTLLADRTPLTERLSALISTREIAALQSRVEVLLASGLFPEPSDEWPPLPWPLV